MKLLRIQTEEDYQAYDDWIAKEPHGTLWQSLEWRQYRRECGRDTRTYFLKRDGKIIASALVIIDSTTFGFQTWNVPRGPVGAERTTILELIRDEAAKAQCLMLTWSPTEETRLPGDVLSSQHIYPDATRVLDITASADDIMKQMKSKGRYNIRLARRHGVTVEESSDIKNFHELMQKTAKRDHFRSLPFEYYKSFYQSLRESFLLLAYHPDKPSLPIAGLLGAIWDDQGIYYYGASDHVHRALMAPYALQWAAIKHCKAKGAKTYDLFGVAPSDASPKHPWAGITSFKEKFGGQLVAYPPERMLVLKPMLWRSLQLKRKLLG